MELRPDVAQVERRLPDGVRRAVEVVRRLGSVRSPWRRLSSVRPSCWASWRSAVWPWSMSSPPCSPIWPSSERAADRPAAPADPVGAFVHRGDAAGLLEPIARPSARRAPRRRRPRGPVSRPAAAGANRPKAATPSASTPASRSSSRRVVLRSSSTWSTSTPRAQIPRATDAASRSCPASLVRAIAPLPVDCASMRRATARGQGLNLDLGVEQREERLRVVDRGSRAAARPAPRAVPPRARPRRAPPAPTSTSRSRPA